MQFVLAQEKGEGLLSRGKNQYQVQFVGRRRNILVAPPPN